MNALASEWFRRNWRNFSGDLFFDEPLSRYTYFRIGGPAAALALPRSEADLAWLSEGIRVSGIPLFVMGAGSNLLVSDSGFPGLVVRATKLSVEISATDNPHLIRTGGGVAVSSLLRRAASEGWGGLEFLAGIPGTIGGAVAMNAGTHLGETKDRVRRVDAFQLLSQNDTESAACQFEGQRLAFEYRRNLFLPKGAIVRSVDWEVTDGAPKMIKARIDEVLARRKATQPLDSPSCGSVFKNPRDSDLSAWQVIDRLGLRGHKMGQAQFSQKHCNFILNLSGAKAADVRALVELAKARALKELGIKLDEELVYL